jgi:integrase
MTNPRLLKRSESPGSPYYARFKVRKKAYLWSTKTNELHLARKRAKAYRDAIVAEQFGLADRMKATNGVATFGQLITAYLKLPTPAKRTRGMNVGAMRAIMGANGLTDSDTVDRMDAQCVARFQQRSLAATANKASATVTCNSRVRCARSLFSKRALACYDPALNLPDEAVRSFFKVPFLREAESRPELPSAQADAKAHQELPGSPEHYRAFLLARYAGLRAGEIKAARRDWLDGRRLCIGGKAEEFSTKSRKWRVVELPENVAELLKLSDDPVFLVGPNRVTVVDRQLPDMLRELGMPKAKPLHSLRRLFGSIVYNTQSPRLDRDALGHRDLSTTEAAYCRSVDIAAPVAFASPAAS